MLSDINTKQIQIYNFGIIGFNCDNNLSSAVNTFILDCAHIIIAN